jgi:hypothetical protein
MDNGLIAEMLMRDSQFMMGMMAQVNPTTLAPFSSALFANVETDELQAKDGLNDPENVYLRVLGYDLAGQMDPRSSAGTLMVRLDNSPPDATGALTLYEQDGVTPFVGSDVIGRANYKVKVQLDVADLAEIARVTFRVMADSVGSQAPVQQVVDEAPPFFLDWTVPRVRNHKDGKLVADHKQRYYVVLDAEDLVGNNATVDTKALWAIDRDSPQAQIYAVNNTLLDVTNNDNVPHIPQAAALTVTAVVDTS